MSEQLKPCPFCGKPAQTDKLQDGTDRQPTWRARCSSETCNPGPYTFRMLTRDQAITAWNTRSPNESDMRVVEKTLQDCPAGTKGEPMTRHVIVEIKPSPEELAKAFCEMDADEQARFFSEIENEIALWKPPFCFQLQAITTSKHLTPGGRFIMYEIGQYSGRENQ